MRSRRSPEPRVRIHIVSIGRVKQVDAVHPSVLQGGEGIPLSERLKRTICGLVAALLAASFVAGMSSAGGGMGNGVADVAPEDETAEVDIATWTVLVYMVADNNLDEYTETDLLELERGGSSEDVNVLIIMDKLYEPAVLMTIEDHKRVVLEELGELNMGDQSTMEMFLEYSDKNYPAEHMVLFFWNHGSGVHGVACDDTMPDGTLQADWLSHHELIAALDGYHMDILAADECSIGQMETMYEYYSNDVDMDYWVASENYISWRGFSYDEILLRLIDDPDMGERALTLVIVEEFTELFSVPPYQSEILTSQSVFDMSKVEPLGAAVLEMASTLSGDMDTYSAVISAAQMASLNPWGARSAGQIDLGTFVQHILDSVDEDDPVVADCEAVLAAYSECIIGMGVCKNNDLYGYTGMGILVPPSYSMYTVASAGSYELYMGFDFPNMGWWAFLETYWGVA